MSKLLYKIMTNGDSAKTVIFDNVASDDLSRKIVTIVSNIKKEFGEKLLEVIPGYQSITIIFSLLNVSEEIVLKKLSKILSKSIKGSTYKSKLIEIPVCYDLDFAPDLLALAEHSAISLQRVIEIHTSDTYLVHMIGFLPGFLYLGGLSSQLHCPRKKTPKNRVPAGSVGIGGNQTGVYPVESPGGWHIIGRTPIPLFYPNNENPVIASPLDRIKFVSINQSEFLTIQKQAKIDPQ